MSKEAFKKLEVVTDYCYTITTKQMRVPNAGVVEIEHGRYRYLTEKECFLLMGFTTEDYAKLSQVHQARAGKMNSVLYKQVGNSIVVNVLENILKEIFKIELKKND